MKKQLLNWNWAVSLCLAIMGFVGSCTPFDTCIFPPIVPPIAHPEDDITEFTNFPTQDEVSAHLHATGYVLYYFSAASVTPNEASLVDNLLKRYATIQPWNISIEPRQGDMFLFLANEFDAIASNPQFLAALKKMFASGVILAMEGGFETDFSNVCKALGCYDLYDGISDATHLPGEKPLWIFSGPLPSTGGIFMKLCPSDESIASSSFDNKGDVIKTGFFSDFVQGHVCDLAVGAIRKALTPRAPTNAPQELTSLVDAYKYITQLSQTIPQPDFYNYKVKEDRTNIYQVELDIYNAFSESEQRNYYYIHAEMICPFKNTYIGVFHSDRRDGGPDGDMQQKSCGFYGHTITLKSRHFSDDNGVVLHKHSPQSTQLITNYESGISFSLGGAISLLHGPTISAGVDITNKQSYEVSDIIISNYSTVGSAPNASWKFELKEPTPHAFPIFYFAETQMDEGSLTGRTTFTGGTDFIISMPQNHSPHWYMEYAVEVVMMYAYGGKSYHPDIRTALLCCDFNLPAVK